MIILSRTVGQNLLVEIASRTVPPKFEELSRRRVYGKGLVEKY